MRTVKDKVKKILEQYPEARNSDKILIKLFWLKFHNNLVAKNIVGEWVLLDSIIDFTSSETIVRCRRLIQHKENLFLATDAVVLERRKKEKGVKFTINSASPTSYLPV